MIKILIIITYTSLLFSSDVYMDKETDLMWQANSLTKTKNWYKAKKYCSYLTIGNYTDWRLPNISEMYSLKSSGDRAKNNFNRTTTMTYYWTDSMYNKKEVIYVRLLNGIYGHTEMVGKGGYFNMNIRCVRN